MASKYGNKSKTQFYRGLRQLKEQWENNVKQVEVELDVDVEDAELIEEAIDGEYVEEFVEDGNLDDTDEEEIGIDESFLCEDCNEEALDELRYIVCKGRLSISVTDKLLNFLSKNTPLRAPKRYSSLMKTPRKHLISPISVGLY